MDLKKYQIDAVKKLLSRSKELIEQNGVKKIIFKAPTGSGKTIMTAELLKQIVNDKDLATAMAFIWTAPRKLHLQSKQKLEKYYEETRALECSDFEELTDNLIAEKEILFLNWESINKKDKNTIVKENEREFYLSKVVENTKAQDRIIILIIDESHHHATSEISQGLINDIAPKLTIEVSATPIIQDPDDIVSVPLEEVKLAGMIKKSVVLNPNFRNVLSGDILSTSLANGTEAMVLAEALKKRAEIVKLYSEEGANVNPLLLIQLPDRKTEQEEILKDEVTRILKDEYSITVENGKLAIYLSEEKENLANIARNDNETEVLIFKQAIALGWDCPRAQILVLFRDWKSLIFSVQTVGRIMRMPEPSQGHYRTEALNHGYIYTNLANIEINEDVARNYVTIYTSKRIEGYTTLNLDSVFRLRQREKTRLSPLFVQLFLQEANNYNLASKIDINPHQLELSLISDYEAEGVDRLARQHITGEVKINPQSETDLQKLLDYFVRNNLSPYYPEDRSIGRVKEAIYYYFHQRHGIDYAENFLHIVNVVLNPNNIKHFINVLDSTKERYKRETEQRIVDLQDVEGWEIPEAINYGGNYTEIKVNKSAMKPFYSDNRWKPEAAFIQFLDEAEQVEWWFKNGDQDSIYFAVSYVEEGETKPFFVDFIIRYKNGLLGLFDTKSGRTISDAKGRSDGLQKYISDYKGKTKFIGGIVTNTDPRNFTGRWMLFRGKGSEIRSDDFSNWELFEV